VAFRKGVPTFSGSRGLGRGTRKTQTERRSIGMLLCEGWNVVVCLARSTAKC
jgi:hypothetical protein